MEVLQQTINDNPSLDVKQALEEQLRGMPDLERLELLTEILTAGSTMNQRFAELIYAAWTHICGNNLWSFKYDSLEQYRQLVSYRDTISPIIARFKRSDRAKASSIGLIERNWKVPIVHVLPREMIPDSWSKHLLFLLGVLSRKKGREEAAMLLAASVKNRPHQSRHQNSLIASDVQRVLDDLAAREGMYHSGSVARSFVISRPLTCNR